MTRLENLYYDPAHYAGYSASDNLSRAAKPNFSRKEVACWLESQDAYTLHRPSRRKFPRLRYNVTNIDDLWEDDLIELCNLKSYNDGFSYLLVIIDVLSKFVWVEPLRDKTSNCVTSAFQNILSRSDGRVPVYLQTDKGKEFIARPMQDFLKERGIRYRVTRNPAVKAAVVERFTRTLKERMWRYFTHKNTRRYIEVLQDIVRAYNHTRHSSIRMQPAIVTRENVCIARENMERRRGAGEKAASKVVEQKAKFDVNDLVRVSRAKATFEKGYEARWSEEYFEFVAFFIGEDPACTNCATYRVNTSMGFFMNKN
ncbi:uncharacterized protein LOC105423016 [Pogonomyrmex barbatus]|uniref:Uncharacterized protein LOC105423016 n=1 Tax=Pogonomyrmex barbatus TaxID=144034 RepID=A0A6I9VVQ6_9HYME|nr:uncharacterized protein LOC105423016 [Pogonomyrmex barbatus]